MSRTFDHMAIMLAALRPAFTAAQYEVWNCTPGSRLEVFEKRDLRETI